jgi:hypothetical protein
LVDPLSDHIFLICQIRRIFGPGFMPGSERTVSPRNTCLYSFNYLKSLTCLDSWFIG